MSTQALTVVLPPSASGWLVSLRLVGEAADRRAPWRELKAAGGTTLRIAQLQRGRYAELPPA